MFLQIKHLCFLHPLRMGIPTLYYRSEKHFAKQENQTRKKALYSQKKNILLSMSKTIKH